MGDEKQGGVVWRTIFTVAVGLGWLVWLLLWWAFWSEDLTVAQRFSVSIVSLMVMGALMAAVWLPFSMRYGDEREQWGAPGFRWRVAVSVVGFVALSGVLAYMLWDPWKDFDLCQSLVVIIITVIGGGVMMTPLWLRWGGKRPTREGPVLEDFAEEVSEAIEEAIEEVYEGSREDDD